MPVKTQTIIDPPCAVPPDRMADMKKMMDGFTRLDRRMRVLLQRDGRLLSGCSGMDDLFEMGLCLRLTDGTVSTALPEFHDPFLHLLRTGVGEVRMLALPCKMTEGHLLVRATALGEHVVCMTLQQATEMIEPELPNLEDVFHLTRAEASIVHDLFMGRTPQQIAVDHDNSIHTIRAHIRRCYDKLGITCREQLWRKLNAYRIS